MKRIKIVEILLLILRTLIILFISLISVTSPWNNPSAATDKVEWVQKYIPNAYKRLILSHNKNLNVGDYLIDDRTANGAGEFGGTLLQYGTDGIKSENLRSYFFMQNFNNN